MTMRKETDDKRMQTASPDETPQAVRHDRLRPLRQILGALFSVLVIAAVVGLATRYRVMGVCGVVGSAVLFSVLCRLPTAGDAEDGGRG